MLVNSVGEVVTREEIRKTLWPNDTVVEFDHSIHTAIDKLRQALNDWRGPQVYRNCGTPWVSPARARQIVERHSSRSSRDG